MNTIPQTKPQLTRKALFKLNIASLLVSLPVFFVETLISVADSESLTVWDNSAKFLFSIVSFTILGVLPVIVIFIIISQLIRSEKFARAAFIVPYIPIVLFVVGTVVLGLSEFISN